MRVLGQQGRGWFGICGGGGGIRTHETLARLPVFKTGAFNHSATSPLKNFKLSLSDSKLSV